MVEYSYCTYYFIYWGAALLGRMARDCAVCLLLNVLMTRAKSRCVLLVYMERSLDMNPNAHICIDSVCTYMHPCECMFFHTWYIHVLSLSSSLSLSPPPLSHIMIGTEKTQL